MALLALLFASLSAQGEVTQRGGLRISLDAQLRPRRLPRKGGAPVAVAVVSRLTTTDRSVPPPLKSLRIEINRHGRLDNTGLPECRIGQIQPATTARALAACRSALVGRGRFSLDVLLGSQERYPTTGRLLLFNGRLKGDQVLFGQFYAAHPFANSFVIPFRIEHQDHGSYGITLDGTFPPAFTDWGHVTGLDLRLARRYRYRRARHSFLSAVCPAPAGFDLVSFPLVRVSFALAGGTRFSSTLTRNCRARR
jgi:hypothetical protein